MMRAAICGGPVGRASGLTPDALKMMGGKTYMGEAAVRAGLATGVATREEVLTYALATAGQGGAAMPGENKDDDKDKAPPGDARAEDDEDKGPDSEHEEKATTCAHCKAGLKGARFCGMCGTDSVPPMKDDEEDKEPESSKRGAAVASKTRAFAAPISPAARHGATVAEMLGLRADASQIATLTALAEVCRVFDFGKALTGKSTAGGIIGELKATAEDAARTSEVHARLDAANKRAAYDERLGLAKRWAAVPGVVRTDVLADVVSGDKRVGVKPGPLAATMPLDELKAYVEKKEASAPPKRSPLVVDADAAKAVSDAAKNNGKPSAAAIEAAKKAPAVIAAFNRSENTRTLEQLAEAHAQAFGGAP